MSTATATAAEPAAPPKGSKKKLIIIIAIAAIVLAGGGVAAMLLLKKKPVDAEGADGEEAAPAATAHATSKHDPKKVPTFVPLEAFTVNLADREAERYAQVGITLELDDPHVGDQIKSYMPAIRNQILMAIADRKADELLAREGKTQLAEKIRRETSRVLGFEVEDDEDHGAPAAEDKAAGKKKKKKKAAAPLPITAVHFSNFIIQ